VASYWLEEEFMPPDNTPLFGDIIYYLFSSLLKAGPLFADS
jgi:hypothetical protein